ncbi:MAG: NADH-quinone oxidoreductase subunit N [Sumerlaeia bacterium]
MFSEITAYVPQFGFNEVAPFLILITGALLVLALDAVLDLVIKGITNQRRDAVLSATTLATILVSGCTFLANFLGLSTDPFLEGSLRADEFANLGSIVILFGGLVFVLMAPPILVKRKLPAGEVFALVLFSLVGMTMLTVANELLVAFICIEILSLSLYVLVGVDRRSRNSAEASFKYFILGAFASAFLVMGIAFLFGATGTTQLFGPQAASQEILEARAAGTPYGLPLDERNYNLGMDQIFASGERLVSSSTPSSVVEETGIISVSETVISTTRLNPVWVFLGFSLVLVGLCFKLSLAPFHMWAPDVYEGAPTITAMFVATSSKVAAFAFLIHLVEAMNYWEFFPKAAGPLLGAIAVLSIIWGNVGALVQTNIKRMLAYSSIAHGGYICVGIATLASESVFSDVLAQQQIRNAVIFYLFGYTLMNVMAFGIAAYLNENGDSEMSHYKGLYKRHPWIASAMSLTMISLMGLAIPGTVGFWNKYMLVKESINAELYILAIAIIVGSAISAYYYIRLVIMMHMQDAEGSRQANVVAVGADGCVATAFSAIGTRFILGLTTAMIVLFGVIPFLFFALG